MVGFIDTDLARNIDAPKIFLRNASSEPRRVERGDGQALADEITRKVHRGLSADFPAYFQST